MENNVSTKKTGIRKLLLSLACLLCAITAFADGVRVQADAPGTVSVGQRFPLSFIVNDRASDITLPEIEGFQVLMGPSTSTSSSHTYINGKMESSRQTTFTYLLRADKAGSYTLPEASVTVNGQTYKSNTPTIKVVEGAVQSNAAGTGSNGNQASGSESGAKVDGSGDLFITQTLTKQNVYEGEGTQLVTKVYTRVNLNSIQDRKNPRLTEFVVIDLQDQNVTFHEESVNGQIYSVAEIGRSVIIPQKSGKINIEPTEVEFLVKKRVRHSGGGGFFDSFFDDVQMSRQRVRTKSVTLNVRPLPQGKPAGFSGGVGSYKFDVSVSPTETEVDNSVTVKVTVEGEGNLKLLSMPKPKFHSDFDSFDPSQKSDLDNTAQGFRGRRTDEYLIIPRRDGEFEIPAITFSYFDTASGQYKSISKGPFTINVKKGEGSSRGQNTGVTFNGAGPEQVTYTNSDLRYLHRSKGLTGKGDFFVLSPLFWILVLLPLGVLGVLWFVYRKSVYERTNAGLVKSRKANKVAKKRLKTAAKFIAEDKREAFFDEVMRALWGYLSDKLTMPLSVLTKDNAKEKMGEHGVAPEAAEEFMALLDECEFARYAPAAVSSTLDDVYQKAAEVIEKIEGNAK